MESTSATQYRHALEGGVPALEYVREDVWALGTAMPGRHIPYSLTYLLRSTDGRLHIVDPGWESADNWLRLLSALTQLGATPADIETILVTHLHLDHLGMAARLQAASGAAIFMHRAELEAHGRDAGPLPSGVELDQLVEQWQVPGGRRDEILSLSPATDRPPVPSINARSLEDGEFLDIRGFALQALWTPGHTTGHVCFVDAERGLIFSGDHVLPTMHAGIGLGGRTVTNPLADYVASLDRVAMIADLEVLPGHGYRFIGLAERATQSREHHLKRTREVETALEREDFASTWHIASQLTWTAGWGNLRGFFLFSALHQTNIHRDYALRSGHEPKPAVWKSREQR